MKAVMTLREAKEETPFSVDQLKAAIRQTDPSGYPPPLRAKSELNRDGSLRRYLVLADDLKAWLKSLPDA